MKIYSKKNLLDEHEEQVLLHVEKQGFWVGFWGLFIAIVIQLSILRRPFETVAGEMIVFFVMVLMILAGCVRNGIWDRHLRASWKTNLAASAVAGLGVLGITIFQCIRFNLDGKVIAISSLGGFGITFLVTMGLMTLISYLTKKRRDSMEKEEEE